MSDHDRYRSGSSRRDDYDRYHSRDDDYAERARERSSRDHGRSSSRDYEHERSSRDYERSSRDHHERERYGPRDYDAREHREREPERARSEHSGRRSRDPQAMDEAAPRREERRERSPARAADSASGNGGGARSPDAAGGSAAPAVRRRRTGFDKPVPNQQQAPMSPGAEERMQQQLSRPARRVYIGNLPFDPNLTEAALQDFVNTVMRKRGFANADSELDAAISVWKSPDGKFAFVEMRSVEDAQRAQMLDGILLGGRPLRVGRTREFQPPPGQGGGQGGGHGGGHGGGPGPFYPPPGMPPNCVFFGDSQPNVPDLPLTSPTHVVVMLNVARPEELEMMTQDEYNDLVAYIGQECERFGDVDKVIIPTRADKDAFLRHKFRAYLERDPDESRAIIVGDITDPLVAHGLMPGVAGYGKVFVKFKDVAAAEKAVEYFHLRQFGPRACIAAFANEAEFERGEL